MSAAAGMDTDEPLASRDVGKKFGGDGAADEGEYGYARDGGPYRY